MKDLRTLLRDADPAAGDPGLSPLQVDAMRRVVVDAARRPDAIETAWQRPLAVVAMIALTLAAGVLTGRNLSLQEPAADAPRIVPTQDVERRQLQFSTPGGTRIIWVFDPEFELKETLP